MAGSPRIIARPTARSPAACRRARVRQGRAFGGAEEAPSLTAAARDGNGNMRSGRKNARGAGRTKEWNDKEDKNGVIPIDKESPIQAGCPNRACPDLCGGCPVMGIPTAILGQLPPPIDVRSDSSFLREPPSMGGPMKFPRRQFLHLAAGAAALPTVSRIAGAQSYPSRPVTMIVPSVAGGVVDTLGRIVAERIRVSLGQPGIIENVGGASGSIAAGRVARAPPDGYMLVIGNWSTHVIDGAIWPSRTTWQMISNPYR
jgi:Tripartite tricarboxylate transporter family receptor